jgi:hypothetical protein
LNLVFLSESKNKNSPDAQNTRPIKIKAPELSSWNLLRTNGRTDNKPPKANRDREKILAVRQM